MHVTQYAQIVGYIAAIDEQLIPVVMDIHLKQGEINLHADDLKALDALVHLHAQHTELIRKKIDLSQQLEIALAEGLTTEPLPEFHAAPFQEGDMN